jgi:hypothetical protein
MKRRNKPIFANSPKHTANPVYKSITISLLTILLFCLAASANTNTNNTEKESLEIKIGVAIAKEGFKPYDRGGVFEPGSGFQWLSQAGEPDIPWKVMTIAVGPDVKLSSIAGHIDEGFYESMKGTWEIQPAGPAATWHEGEQVVIWPENKRIVQGRDADIYERDMSWPDAHVRILSTGKLRQWKLVQVAVPIARYNPVSNQMMALKEDANLQIEFERSVITGPVIQPDRIAISAVKRIAANFDEVRAEYESNPVDETNRADENSRYVIITTSEIESASSKLADFVTHKQAIGFDVQIITEEDFGGGLGDTASENIRAWLQQHYLSDNIEYVLLIGNPHPASGDVPMKMLWPRNNSGKTDVDSPSDYYYADLTGNWDLDEDGFYGEWPKRNGRDGDFGDGGVDRFWEVLVGRIPHYGNISETDAILERIIAYERQDDNATQWRSSCLLPMEPSDSSTPGFHLGEQIKDAILTPNGWSYNRVYEEIYGLVPPPEFTPCDYDTVTDAWSTNPSGLVIWWTHGNIAVAADIMDLAHLPSLDDNYPSFTFQVSCLNSYPEANNNLAYELLCHGGINTVAATRVSWYYIGQTQFAGSPSNSGMSYEYSSRFISDELPSGPALHDLKQVLAPGNAEMWMNFTVFNIYGDPSCHVTPVSYSNLPIPGDFDNDWDVDLLDFATLSAAWLAEPQDLAWNPACDLSESPESIIDGQDLNIFVDNWLQTQGI